MNTWLRQAAAAAGILLLGTGVAACDVNIGNGEFSLGASGRASDTWTHEYTVAAGGRVEVVNANGSIEITQGEGPGVSVRAERTARASTDEDAKALLQKVQIVETVAPDSVRLETKAPKSFGRGGVEVKYSLTVPKGLHLAPRTSNGTITLTGLTNDVDAATTNGGVKGDALAGSVVAETTNGGITLDVTSLGAGGLRASTTNGGIRLQLPSDVKADLSVQVTNGGIGIDNLKVETTGDQNRRHLEGRVNGGGPPVSLSTTNGGIHVSGR
jgi:hypothetical protein